MKPEMFYLGFWYGLGIGLLVMAIISTTVFRLWWRRKRQWLEYIVDGHYEVWRRITR